MRDGYDIRLFVKVVDDYYVRSLDELRMRTMICKHIEYSLIDIEFDDNFSLE